MSEIMNIPEIFGSDVFSEATMKERLPESVFAAWKDCIAKKMREEKVHLKSGYTLMLYQNNQ